MAKKNRKPIYLFVLALVILYIITFTIPDLTGILKRTELLEPGSIKVTEEVSCYFIRTEDVYGAKNPGDLNYLAKEGTHVRKGKKIVDLASKTISGEKDNLENSQYKEIADRLGSNIVISNKYSARTSGILSTYVDGYEAYFTPSKMKKIKYEDVEKLRSESVNVKRKTTITKEPLFKISDNDSWYIMCWVESGSVENYETGKTVTIKLPEGDVKANVDSVIAEEDDKWKIIFQSNRYYKAFSESRVEDAGVISKDSSGLIVSNGSITTIDGQAGVVVRKKDGSYKFKRVKVIASDGKESVLKDVNFLDENKKLVNTVNVYDEVLKNPKEYHK